MPFPHRKSSIEPRPSQALAMRGGPSRLQRRKLARRRKTSIQLGALLIANCDTDQIGLGNHQRLLFPEP